MRRFKTVCMLSNVTLVQRWTLDKYRSTYACALRLVAQSEEFSEHVVLCLIVDLH